MEVRNVVLSADVPVGGEGRFHGMTKVEVGGHGCHEIATSVGVVVGELTRANLLEIEPASSRASLHRRMRMHINQPITVPKPTPT